MSCAKTGAPWKGNLADGQKRKYHERLHHNCKFCNFRIPGHPEAYITDIDTYKKKIEETIRYGGDELLLQGGHHPELGLSFYVNLSGTEIHVPQY